MLVLCVRPVRLRSVFLATFCAGLGVWTAVFYLVSRDDPFMPFAAPLACAALLASAAGLAGLSLAAPTPLAKNERTLLVAPVAVAVIGLIVMFWGTLVGIDAWMRATGVAPSERVWEITLVLPYTVLASVAAGVLVLFPLRARRAANAQERSQFGFMAAGILVYMGLVAGIFFKTPLTQTLTIAWALALGVGCGAAVWLANTRQPGGSRQGRNLALFYLGTVLVGMVAGEWLGGFAGASGAGVYGVARTLAILVLAYAILRHQLLGIDVKIRFALSKSTVAAVFIGVFFVASEAAQQFFGDRLGSAYVGIAAAGMLVFAIAPLQRVAERIAEKAVPVAAASTASPQTRSPSRREEAYREAVRLALRDQRVTAAERVSLFRLAEELDIPAGRAAEIQAEAERKVKRRAA